MNDISGFSYKFIVAGLKVKKDFMCTKCCYLWTYLKIWAQMHYFSSSLVLAAVQQERQIQKWSNELAVYCLGLNQGVNKKQGRQNKRTRCFIHAWTDDLHIK